MVIKKIKEEYKRFNKIKIMNIQDKKKKLEKDISELMNKFYEDVGGGVLISVDAKNTLSTVNGEEVVISNNVKVYLSL